MDLERMTPGHPLWEFLHGALRDALEDHLFLRDVDDVVTYLMHLFAGSIRSDGYLSSPGRPAAFIPTVSDLIAEAEMWHGVRSFDEEREAYRQTGDQLLFWSGLFPEHLMQMRGATTTDAARVGRISYHVVSTFDYGRYADEAPTFRKLCDGFEEFQQGLAHVRKVLPGLGA